MHRLNNSMIEVKLNSSLIQRVNKTKSISLVKDTNTCESVNQYFIPKKKYKYRILSWYSKSVKAN